MLFAPDGMFVQSGIILTGIIGQIYNTKRDVKSYYYWFVTNVLLCYVSFVQQQWGGFFLFVFYMIASFYSVFQWKRLDEASILGATCRRGVENGPVQHDG